MEMVANIKICEFWKISVYFFPPWVVGIRKLSVLLSIHQQSLHFLIRALTVSELHLS